MARPAISAKSLGFSYPECSERLFSDADFEIPEGARTLVLGANGVGKSTLLRLLSGRHMIRDGRVEVYGKDPFSGGLGPKDLGLVAEKFEFNLDVPVGDLLARQPARNKKYEAELLELLQIDLEWRMHRVSNGQRRRVDLLLSFLPDPRLLLLDEVTSDLDILVRQDLLRWMKTKKGLTVVFATHILDNLLPWTTHLLFLSPGRVRFFGTLAMLKKEKTWRAAAKKYPQAPLLGLCEKWIGEDRKNGFKKV